MAEIIHSATLLSLGANWMMYKYVIHICCCTSFRRASTSGWLNSVSDINWISFGLIGGLWVILCLFLLFFFSFIGLSLGWGFVCFWWVVGGIRVRVLFGWKWDEAWRFVYFCWLWVGLMFNLLSLLRLLLEFCMVGGITNTILFV